MRPGLVLTLIVSLAILAACATKEERGPDQATKDDILTAVFIDYISNMPPDAKAKGRKAFYVTAGREEVSPTVIRRLQRRWPSLISRRTFDLRYGNMDASWGYYGAEIRSYRPKRALVATWSSHPYETSRRYVMERNGEVWTVQSSQLDRSPIDLSVRAPRPSPSPTPVRPFYP